MNPATAVIRRGLGWRVWMGLGRGMLPVRARPMGVAKAYCYRPARGFGWSRIATPHPGAGPPPLDCARLRRRSRTFRRTSRPARRLGGAGRARPRSGACRASVRIRARRLRRADQFIATCALEAALDAAVPEWSNGEYGSAPACPSGYKDQPLATERVFNDYDILGDRPDAEAAKARKCASTSRRRTESSVSRAARMRAERARGRCVADSPPHGAGYVEAECGWPRDHARLPPAGSA